jgi:hypothetical protein
MIVGAMAVEAVQVVKASWRVLASPCEQAQALHALFFSSGRRLYAHKYR